MNLKDKEHKSGYDAEELYFEKLNRELINRMKEERNKGETQSQGNGESFESAKTGKQKAA